MLWDGDMHIQFLAELAPVFEKIFAITVIISMHHATNLDTLGETKNTLSEINSDTGSATMKFPLGTMRRKQYYSYGS